MRPHLIPIDYSRGCFLAASQRRQRCFFTLRAKLDLRYILQIAPVYCLIGSDGSAVNFLKEVITIYIVAAMLLDAVFGDPRRIPHPVSGIGRIITFWERFLYGGKDLKLRGFFFCAAVLFSVGFIVFFIFELAAAIHPFALRAAEIYLLYAALAYRSLKDEAMAVASALGAGNIPLARRNLSGIVGRDTAPLLENGIVRAAVETVAESYVDGVVSVLFYMVLGSFAGYAALSAWIFKAVSTMDSMVGFDDERYRDFGFAAAKLDDVMNFIPARLGALLALFVSLFSAYDSRGGFRVFRRDRRKHKSPNSAHGESVFAGLLGIALGGGAYYDGVYEKRPWIGDNNRAPEAGDIWKACDILDRAYMLCVIIVVFIIMGGTYV